MPVKVRCRVCGETFYVGPDPIPVNKFINLVESCKRCGNRFDPNKIEFTIDPIFYSDDEEEFL